MIARIFPRRTRATPIDKYSFIGDPLFFMPDDINKIHISVTFTWDIQKSERLYNEWKRIAPVEIGGIALGEKSGEFEPGKYLKEGYIITSRGCRNRCWFCSVWKREGNIRELKIKKGNNVLDDNLLACSESHIKKVFSMLKKQKGIKEFTGGLEAAILKEWHVKELKEIKPKQIFFAYDTNSDREPLFEAGILLRKYGFKIKHPLRAYVLIGYPGDTFKKADKRLYETIEAGFLPCAMLYRNNKGITEYEWRKFQRKWFRPAIISKIEKEQAG